MVTILDGRSFARERGQKLKEKIKLLWAQKIQPTLCVINIGDDPASKIYLRTKQKKAASLGIKQKVFQFAANSKQDEVLALIEKLNLGPQVNGIMVQLPVPEQINEEELLAHIDPNKDVDCLTPSNVGRLWSKADFVRPATPAGIMALLAHYQISLSGKNAVIIGRSNIVGKPLAALLLAQDATVILAHSQTRDLMRLTSQADILISAAGRAQLVTREMVKAGAVIIDVGMNRVQGHLVGDVDFAGVQDKCSYITPVPGGVGPLTVQFLMEQVVNLTQRQHGQGK